MKKTIIKISFLLTMLICIFSQPVFAAADGIYEAAIFAVDNYGSDRCSGKKGTKTGDDLNYRIKIGQSFYDEISSWPKAFWKDNDVHGRRFIEGWAKEDRPYKGTDWADILLYAGHSGRVCSADPDYLDYYSAITMGRNIDGTTCSPNTYGNEHRYGMYFGDNDLNAVIFAGCQTMHKCVKDHGGYDKMKGRQLNIINGFHGVSYDGYWYWWDMDDYFEDSYYNGIGEDWLDENYFNDGSKDQCPTSLVYGSSASKNRTMFYNGGFHDLKKTGTSSDPYYHPYRTYFYIGGCNPIGGITL